MEKTYWYFTTNVLDRATGRVASQQALTIQSENKLFPLLKAQNKSLQIGSNDKNKVLVIITNQVEISEQDFKGSN